MAVRLQQAAQARAKTRQHAAARRLHLTGGKRARTQLSAAFYLSEAAPESHLSMLQMRTLRAPAHVSGCCRNQPEARRLCATED